MSKIQKLIVLTALLFLAHFIEEAIFDFYKVDVSTNIIAEYTGISAMVLWLAAQVLVILVCLALWFNQDKFRKLALFILFVVFAAELHHPFEAIRLGAYVPGLITSFFFPIAAYNWLKSRRGL
jgi:hypothetical protein